MLVTFVFYTQLRREGFFSTSNPSQEDLDVQIMEQGFLIRRKRGRDGGKAQEQVVVFKGYGSVEGS